MRNLSHLDEYRKPLHGDMGDEHNGMFVVKLQGSMLDFKVLASNGDGWDHVSVSTENRCPKWNEMCQIKDMFFEEDEVVVQYHPAKKDYINIHPNCLHLWRRQGGEVTTPPKYMVGPSYNTDSVNKIHTVNNIVKRGDFKDVEVEKVWEVTHDLSIVSTYDKVCGKGKLLYGVHNGMKESIHTSGKAYLDKITKEMLNGTVSSYGATVVYNSVIAYVESRAGRKITEEEKENARKIVAFTANIYLSEDFSVEEIEECNVEDWETEFKLVALGSKEQLENSCLKVNLSKGVVKLEVPFWNKATYYKLDEKIIGAWDLVKDTISIDNGVVEELVVLILDKLMNREENRGLFIQSYEKRVK